MNSAMISVLIMESARRYTRLSSEIFSFSIEQSSFASKVASQRISLANVVVTKNKNFKYEFDKKNVVLSQSMDLISVWSDCINLDIVLQEAFREEVPIFYHFQYALEKSEFFLNEITNGRKEILYECSVCGAVYAAKEAAQIIQCEICVAEPNLQTRL